MALTDKQRRANGQRRVVVWLDASHAKKLDVIVDHSGHDIPTIVRGYIDEEYEGIEALTRRRSHHG